MGIAGAKSPGKLSISPTDLKVNFELEENEYFVVDSDSGVVTLAKQIDREQVPELRLKVYARDDAGTALEDESEIVILVEDVNDQTPQFEQKKYSGSVPENSPIGKREWKCIANDAAAF